MECDVIGCTLQSTAEFEVTDGQYPQLCEQHGANFSVVQELYV